MRFTLELTVKGNPPRILLRFEFMGYFEYSFEADNGASQSDKGRLTWRPVPNKAAADFSPVEHNRKWKISPHITWDNIEKVRLRIWRFIWGTISCAGKQKIEFLISVRLTCRESCTIRPLIFFDNYILSHSSKRNLYRFGATLEETYTISTETLTCMFSN